MVEEVLSRGHSEAEFVKCKKTISIKNHSRHVLVRQCGE